jgi:hypothetical protein
MSATESASTPSTTSTRKPRAPRVKKVQPTTTVDELIEESIVEQPEQQITAVQPEKTKPKRERVVKEKTPDTERKTALNGLIYFLNNYFRNKSQRITFRDLASTTNNKTVSQAVPKLTISLDQYTAITSALDSYEKHKDWKKVLAEVNDFRLFTCLSKASDLSGCFDVIHVEKAPTHDIDFFIKSIQDEFLPENKQKLKIKIYNNIFPHGNHLTEDEFKARYKQRSGKDFVGDYRSGVNIIYLQHYTSLFDDVLAHLVNGKDSTFIINYVRKRFSESKLVDIAGLDRAQQLQLVTQLIKHPDILEHSKDKRIKDLKVCDKTGKLTDAVLSKVEKTNILNLLREIGNVQHLIHVFETGKQAEPSVNISECYAKFLDLSGRIDNFDTSCDLTKEGFVSLFTRAYQLYSSVFGPGDMLKYILNGVKKQISFRLQKGYRSRLVEGNSSTTEESNLSPENIEALASELADSLVKERASDYSDLGFYIKISKYFSACDSLDKDTKAAFGTAMLGYVFDCLKDIRATTKRKDLFVYIN